MSINNTYKYHFKVEGIIVHTDVTEDLKAEEMKLKSLGVYTIYREKKLYWKDGLVEQIESPTTFIEAIQWKNQNATPLNYDGVYLDEDEIH